jgi:hypothetical protein
LVLVTKNSATRYQLHPDSFLKARDAMTQLKNNTFSQSPYTSVFIDWALLSQQYHRRWVVEAAKLDLHQIDAVVRGAFTQIALSFVGVPGIESSGFQDSLNENALKMAKLLAVTHQLIKSNVSVQPMAVGIARVFLFYLLTIYAMEMCDASLRFAEALCTAIRDRTIAERSVQHAIRVYSQVIDKIMALEHSESFILEIFAPIQPRLQELRSTIHALDLSVMSGRKPQAKNHAVVNFAGLKPFNIAIGLKPAEMETLSTAVSRQDMGFDQLHYTVQFLLRKDFDSGVNSAFVTIDPHWLSPTMATQNTTAGYEPSTSLFSREGVSNVFSSAVGGSQTTNITYPHYDGPALYASLFENTTGGYVANSSYIGGPFERENDFSNIGSHLPN